MGKTSIGAFYQPRHVHIDVETLATLPAREFSAGMAEVIKYGIIRDRDFFTWLDSHREALSRLISAASDPYGNEVLPNQGECCRK